MAKLTKKTLQKHLEKSDKEDLIREVITLFNKFKNVKEFYTAELTNDANPLLETYKKKITKAYSLANPKERSTNINVNKLINEFKKTSIYNRDVADLMLHRVECGMAAFNKSTNRSSTFYNCIANTFGEAINIITGDDYTNEFISRINKILAASKPGKFEFQNRLNGIAKALN